MKRGIVVALALSVALPLVAGIANAGVAGVGHHRRGCRRDEGRRPRLERQETDSG